LAGTVVLKSLNNSRGVTAEFLREITNHKLFANIMDARYGIIPCYGISQDPQTGNYLMVMEYVEGGNLRQFLKSSCPDF